MRSLLPLLLSSCVRHPSPASYADTAWPAWSRALPAEAQLAPADAPAESWWPWAGHEVHLDTYAPDGPERGTMIVVHGGGGHGRLLSPFAAPLRRAGYRVIAPDLPGFGLTRSPRGEGPSFATWVALVADLACAEQARGARVAVFGASLGGTVALHAAMRCAAIEAVAVTTLLDLQDTGTMEVIARRPWTVGWMRRFGRPFAGVSMRVRGVAPLDKMSSFPGINQALADDPLVGRRRVPLGFYLSFADAAPPTPVVSFDRAPVWVAHPAADAWTPPALSQATFDALPGPKRWVDLEGATHFPLEQPGYGELQATLLELLAEVWPQAPQGAR